MQGGVRESRGFAARLFGQARCSWSFASLPDFPALCRWNTKAPRDGKISYHHGFWLASKRGKTILEKRQLLTTTTFESQLKAILFDKACNISTFENGSEGERNKKALGNIACSRCSDSGEWPDRLFLFHSLCHYVRSAPIIWTPGYKFTLRWNTPQSKTQL